ncbi:MULTISPECIES: hypothetical protein [unclassified Microcoleus]|uniref:hypothetical protein n=1 Tax=unclassified Microcoleus TaxID=2642155 RepID=UPI0025F9E377|nr:MULTISPECIES: hypothetical protein [unclassified Microcoleus]
MYCKELLRFWAIDPDGEMTILQGASLNTAEGFMWRGMLLGFSPKSAQAQLRTKKGMLLGFSPNSPEAQLRAYGISGM